MEKSIESIWKEGFLKSDAMVAPKLNNLYGLKSRHIVDQLMQMGKTNLIAIMVGASLILVGAVLAGAPLTGVFLFLLFSWLVIHGKRHADRMKKIDSGLSSYQYLKAVDNWLKEVIAGYTRIYRVFYPAFFIAFFVGVWSSDFGPVILGKLLQKNPDIYVVNGVPVFLGIGVFLMAGLVSYFAGAIYRFDINLVYGNVFRKIEEIIADMEELRA